LVWQSGPDHRRYIGIGHHALVFAREGACVGVAGRNESGAKSAVE
jgi:hypothetical protein